MPHVSHRRHVFDSRHHANVASIHVPKRFKSIGRCHIENEVPSFERAIKAGVLVAVCQLTLFSVSSRTDLQGQKICARKLDQSSQGPWGFFLFLLARFASLDLQAWRFSRTRFFFVLGPCVIIRSFWTLFCLFHCIHSVKRRELVLFSVRTRSVLICNDG
jgi:hypothetical protein